MRLRCPVTSPLARGGDHETVYIVSLRPAPPGTSGYALTTWPPGAGLSER